MSSPEPSTNTHEPPNLQKKIAATNHRAAEAGRVVLSQGESAASSPDATPESLADSSQVKKFVFASHGDEGHLLKPISQENTITDSHDGMAELGRKAHLLCVSSDPPLNTEDLGKTTDLRRQNLPGSQGLEEPKDDVYLDPTPKTPRQESSPSRGPAAGDEVRGEEVSTSEIQSIMDQFGQGDYAVEDDEEKGTGPETRGCHLGAPVQHPPRRSSLEPLRPANSRPATESMDDGGLQSYELNYAEPSHNASSSDATYGLPTMRTSSLPQSARLQAGDSMTPSSPNSSMSLPKLPPPEPDPEPDLPFDFHRFLEQLRHRTADPVAKFLRSFLIEFGKKQWMVHEQVKIINDFLTFITNKMAQCEVWRGVSDAEFDNAKEGMEKLVMNRLYSQTFSPAIPVPVPIQGPKGKRKNSEKSLGPGRRGQHQEDIERDEILGQKVRIYGWVQEEHLDIPPVGDSGRRFLVLAQQGMEECE